MNVNADLDALAGAAAEADAIAVPPAPTLDENGNPPPPPVDFAGEARGAVDMFAALVVGYAPAAADVWSEAAKSRVAAALGPVMEKYGVSFGDLPPELTLAIVAGPVLYQSAKIIATQAHVERGQAAKAVGEIAPAAETGEGAAASPPNPGVTIGGVSITR